MTDKTKVMVWDVPTRAFHWLLAASFFGAFLTAESERWRDVHVTLGYTMLGLIAFRLIWGLIGTRYARFSSFLYSPRETLVYVGSLIGGRVRHYVGHNPAGALAIFALIALGVLTAASGWAMYEEIGGEWLEDVHEALADAMMALVVLHIAGALVSSLLHRENLVRAMLTGRKQGEPSEGIRRAHAWLGALVVASVAAFWVSSAMDTPPGVGKVASVERGAQGHHASDRHDDD